MIDIVVGRLLVASLHQSIADLLPARLEFYEGWLSTTGLRDGRIGLAPLAAVLSFLRQEGEPYRRVVERAGAYAAEWTEAALPPWHRAIIRRTPPGVRMYLILRVVRRLISETYGGSQARVTWTHGRGALDIDGSIFCGVRERVDQPLCEFYRAAARTLMERSALEVDVAITECRATGSGRCVMRIAPRAAEAPG
jgi:bacteriochlorophyll 4-vinyl reductase